MNEVDIATVIHNAARECGLDGHVKTLEYRKHICTTAEQIMATYTDLPVQYKASYLYCDRLDVCFYFDSSERACCSYSGIFWYSSNDFYRLFQTAKLMRLMLKAMNSGLKKMKRMSNENKSILTRFRNGEITINQARNTLGVSDILQQKEIHEKEEERD